MITSRLVLLLLSISLGGASAAHAQAPGGFKPGLWETSILKLTIDGKDMLSQMSAMQEQLRQTMAQMPAEQRKRMEAMLGAEMADPMRQRICISPEMAARDESMVPRPKGAECEPPKFNRSGQRITFEVACKTKAGQVRTKGENVLSADRVDSKMETVSIEAGGARHVSITESTMKYLGKDCGSVKPVEQLVQDAAALTGQRQ